MSNQQGSDTVSATETAFQPEPYDETWDDEPITPRAKLRTASKVLIVVAISAAAFAAGIFADRKWGTAGQSSSAFPGGFAALGNGRGQGSRLPLGGGLGGTIPGADANTVNGQVAYRKGRTLYITDSSANIVKVTVPAGLDVTTTAKTTVKGIRPGDTVTVRGGDATGGSLTATSVSIESR
jgi:hypothetical protein